MAEGNERALAYEEIERKGGERQDEHARAKRDQIGVGTEASGEREERKPREEKDRGRLAAQAHRLTGNRPEGRSNSTAAMRM